MTFSKSQYDDAREDSYRRDFHKNSRMDDENYDGNKESESGRVGSVGSYETSENNDGFVITMQLSTASLENLKVIPFGNHIIIQSDEKQQYVNLNQTINPDKVSHSIKSNILTVNVKK